MPIIKAGSINISYETYGEGEALLLIMGFGMAGAARAPSLPLAKREGAVTWQAESIIS
jgi:hypothetical protein